MESSRACLQPLLGQTCKFQAKFIQIAKGKTIFTKDKPIALFREVRLIEGGCRQLGLKINAEDIIIDHVWAEVPISLSKKLIKLAKKEQRLVIFKAKVISYRKGYISNSKNINNRVVDYRLANIRKVQSAQTPVVNTFDDSTEDANMAKTLLQ